MDELLAVLRDMERRIDDMSARLDRADSAIREDLAGLRADVQTIKSQYVTQAEHYPVKTITFSLVGLVMVSVVGALLALVLGKA